MRSIGDGLRFDVRSVDHGGHKHEVWDQVTGQRVDGQTYTERAAHETAATLDRKHTARPQPGPRDPTTVREVDPPKAVVVRLIAQRWYDAQLLCWIHEPNGWHGLLRLDHTPDKLGWYPADRIKLPGTQYG